MKNILVIRLSAMGDVLLTTPLLSRLKSLYPDVKITFLVKEQYREFIAACPEVDEIITWQKDETVMQIRQRFADVRFDLLVDLQSNFKTRMLSLLIGADKKVRYRKPYLNRLLLVYFKKNRYTEKKKISERYLDAINELDSTPLFEKISLQREKLPRAVARFTERGAILIAPGARWATKRWPSEYFVSLASKILEKHLAKKIVWVGGPDEKELFIFLANHPYLRRHTKRMLFLASELSPGQLAALADAAEVIVSNDSGLMHLLSASARPLVALFLSTVEEFGFFPLSKNAEVLAARNIPCRPCSHTGLPECPKKHFRCGRELTADEVYTTVAGHFTKLHPSD